MTGLPWLENASLFASGSDALARLVCWGAREHGWRRVWLPSYYCPEVPAALRAAAADELELRAYADADLRSITDLGQIPAEPVDVVVVANQLGVRARPNSVTLEACGATIVEDHSHDPASEWVLTSTAPYAFASLRKTLPIPDGGAVWSSRGLPLPPEPLDATADPVAAALAARAGLDAPRRARLRFRALARTAAEPGGIAAHRGIAPVSRALLPGMPVLAWREQRRRNIAILAAAVADVAGVRVLAAPAGGVAFALALVFDAAEQREAARAALVARAVAPVVQWPLTPERDWGAGPADADLSSRILSIHADQRYDEADMHQLAGILHEALGA